MTCDGGCGGGRVTWTWTCGCGCGGPATSNPGGNCGGNCPGGMCQSCPCGTTRNLQNIATWCAKYSWSQACCRCIVNAESGGNANAMNGNSNGSLDAGLFQVNSVNWNDCSGGKAPCDPSVNLGCAIKVYQWGQNSFRLWSTAQKCGCA